MEVANEAEAREESYPIRILIKREVGDVVVDVRTAKANPCSR